MLYYYESTVHTKAVCPYGHGRAEENRIGVFWREVSISLRVNLAESPQEPVYRIRTATRRYFPVFWTPGRHNGKLERNVLALINRIYLVSYSKFSECQRSAQGNWIGQLSIIIVNGITRFSCSSCVTKQTYQTQNNNNAIIDVLKYKRDTE